MEKATVKAKLVALRKDVGGYISYIFELLDKEDKDRLGTKLISCVRYPNWECPEVKLHTIGYLEVLEVRAGLDSYFKNGNMVPYKYSNIQFINFVVERNSVIDKTITLD